jgi:serine/threonine protein kinase
MKDTMSNFEVFGKYLLLQKLAEGGMAEVFLARPNSPDGNGRVQVVKRILPHIASHSVFLNMFNREIQIIMGFNHAHTVQLHDSGTVNGQPFIAMEFIEGKNLKDILEKLRNKNLLMPVPMVLSLIAQAAAGLYYAHTFVNKVTGDELNAVHRDISPHNLICSYDGNLKVIDFGIAKAACSMHDRTQTGLIKGKAAYFSPEQLAGQEVDCRTDIFALGAVAWEMLTGDRLFAKPGDTEVTAMQKIANCEKHVIPPSKINKDVPAEVDHIIMMALEKDPKERYQDMREFQAALRQVLSRKYPAYTYAETGKLISAIFAEEMVQERNQIRLLNLQAQQFLVGDDSGKTTTLITKTGSAVRTANMKLPHDETHEGVVDFRLSKIESMLKQKATGRHYGMLAFYIVSLFALKFTENYNFNFDITAQDAKAAELVMPIKPPTPLPQRTSQVTQAKGYPQMQYIKPQQTPQVQMRRVANTVTGTKAKKVAKRRR